MAKRQNRNDFSQLQTLNPYLTSDNRLRAASSTQNDTFYKSSKDMGKMRKVDKILNEQS